MQFFEQQLDDFFSLIARTARERRLIAPPAPSDAFDLSSNDYLCLSRHPQIHAALKQGIDLFGAGSTASRLVAGHRDIFSELEEVYAKWVGSDDALFFANGYAANVGTLTAILDGAYAAFTDRLCHASLLDGVRLSGARKVYFRHNDLSHLEELMSKATEKKRIIIVESLYSMDGDFAPLPALFDLAQRHGALLYVDDAHALGVWGEDGQGLAAGHWGRADFSVGTCGKALGLEGAFVATSSRVKKYLIHNARTFVFSTAPLPAIASAAVAAIRLARTLAGERQRIAEVATFLRAELKRLGYSTLASSSQIIPLLCASERDALEKARRLVEAGFYVKAIRPPTVKESRIRISVNSGITLDTARRFITALERL